MIVHSEKKCLIVLGMHRSGTSALSGALQLTGLDLGRNLMPPADENPKGFFENANITELNERILDELFAKWNDTLLIPEEWWTFDKFEEYAGRISTILQEEFTGGNSILIKDPRLSVLLPLYLSVFIRSGIKPVIVICVRGPFKVAASLKKRNHLSQQKSFLLWMDYQLKAELFSRDLPRIFVSYFDFLNDPLKILKSIRETFGLEMIMNNQTENEVLSFLDPALNHHNLPEQLPETSYFPELKALFDLLINANLRDLTAKELTSVNQIRSQFIGKVRFYNGLADNYEAALEVHFENKEKISLAVPVKYGTNELKFPIIPGHPVTEMIFRPSNSRVGLKILQIEAWHADDSLVKIDKRTTNARHKTKDGLLIFETEIPKIIIEFHSPETISHIDFKLMYLVFGNNTFRAVPKRSGDLQESLQPEEHIVIKKSEIHNNEFLKMQQVVKNQHREIEEIYKSLTWRIGRVVTSPVRMIYKFLGK